MALTAVHNLRLARAWLLRSFALVSVLSGPVQGVQAQHPLEPPDTSSPRETLAAFLTATDEMWTVVHDEGTGKRSRAGLRRMTEDDILARRTLDVSEVAPEARLETSRNAHLHLYEVLSRIALPSINEVPGDDEIEANPDLDRWTLPHTEITIHRVAEGPRRGEFLFAPETVARAKEFYERTEELPYLREPPIENLASFTQVYGGWDVPLAWVDSLPASMRSVVWGQALWKWIFLAVVACVALALVFLVFRLTRRKGRPRCVGRYLSRLAVPATVFAVVVFVVPFVSEEINLTGPVATALNLTVTAVAYVSLAWVVWLLVLASGEAVVAAPRIRAESLDASLIRLTARTIALVAAVILIFQGASKIGLPLVGLIASVSIGGLAIALAAQDTLKSLLGSLMILIDQPYRVGERIIAGGHDGVVERIGLRSTQIRQLDGSVTSIPNESMASMNIENIGRRGSIRRKMQLRIATGTARNKVEQAVQIVRDILADHEGMPPENPPRVYFDEFNPDSLSIRIFYWYEPPDFWAFSDFSERVNLDIIRRFAEAGIALAPPTSRTELSDESGQPLASPGPSEATPES